VPAAAGFSVRAALPAEAVEAPFFVSEVAGSSEPAISEEEHAATSASNSSLQMQLPLTAANRLSHPLVIIDARSRKKQTNPQGSWSV
jgi:hypothetical protein